MNSVFRLLTLIICVFPAAAYAEGFIVGEIPSQPPSGNCVPFGCAGSIPEYQQVYAATSFSGPLQISSLTFFNTPASGYGPGYVPEGTFTIKLSTTNKGVNGLSTNLN